MRRLHFRAIPKRGNQFVRDYSVVVGSARHAGLRRDGEQRYGGAEGEGNSDCGQDDCAFHG